MNVNTTTLGLLTGFILVGLFRWRKANRALPLPPGPRRLPLIQNLLDLPKGLEAPHWAKHKALYGPISSVSVFGTTIVILNDAQVCFDLLDKRSTIYSNRPTLPFGGEMVGLSDETPLLPYGALLKLHRKEIHRWIGTHVALEQFVELEEVETRRFLLRTLEEPSELISHIRTTAGTIILKIAYGYTVTPNEPDPFVDLAELTADIFSKALCPGTWIVDVLPFLRHLPEWLPGLGFKKTARRWREVITDFIDRPFAFVRHQMESGVEVPSLARSLIERNVASVHIMKWIAATLYSAGSDSTVSAASTFLLAMVLYPDALKKAQAEVDYVVGRMRLPTLADREALPYVVALEKEVLRWNTVGPMGFPHVVTEDDTYMGYRIPKGAIVLPNVWQMTHDPAIYRDPFNFKPERFLGANAEPDSRDLAFGFGRRICPGKGLADSSLFLMIAMTVATFNICRAKDASGREVDPVYEYSPGLISHPSPFEYSVKPRDEKAVSLIRAVLDEHPFEEGDADVLNGLKT